MAASRSAASLRRHPQCLCRGLHSSTARSSTRRPHQEQRGARRHDREHLRAQPRIGQVRQAALAIDFYYEEGDKGRFTPVARHVVLEKITMQRAERVLNLRGFPNAPIRDVTLVDCSFGNVDKPDIVEHVEGLSLRNVRVNSR